MINSDLIIGWARSRANTIFKLTISLVMVMAIAACSDQEEPGNALEGSWQLDKSNLNSNSAAYAAVTRSAENITFTKTSAISGDTEMAVAYEPTEDGFIVTFEGMKEGTFYKVIDKNTFEIKVPEVGKFRYVRKQPSDEKNKNKEN